MNENYYTLELHKILEMLTLECNNPYSARMAEEIIPSTDLETVREEVSKTFDAYNFTVRFGTPNFYNFADVSSIAGRAKTGAALSLRELLDVSKMLLQAQTIISWRRLFDEPFKLDYLFD